ncbi:helix-turn-helix domain-containing protein [Saccharopolyspora sp. K220]|uniref:helix-turn-helix domain-containing protein n=1 Tax=Saccharopolyspora soli TaxID=2926618 RepID=UPI001F59C2AE|nr:helix-turn-helix domain-containing protein [Saccharopolyspora soli]MCI2423070.1 helix-turn-helix domain-containing protein [Saccharopolyspora soli]
MSTALAPRSHGDYRSAVADGLPHPRAAALAPRGRDFAVALREARQANGLSQRGLQRRSGLASSDICRYEKGERTPTLEVAHVLDTVLQTGDELLKLARAARRPSPAARSAPPYQLPAPPTILVGRDRELACLDAAARRASTVVVDGMFGVGKTGLVRQWGHQGDPRERWPDGVLFADLRGYSPAGPPAEPTSVLGHLLRSLHVEDIPDDEQEQERAHLLRTVLADRRALIVLDDAANVEQVRPLLSVGPDCTVLITARRRLPGLSIRDGAARVPVEPLAIRAAALVLAAGTGWNVDNPALAEIAAACDRLPLALHAAAVAIGDRAARPPADVVAELTGAQGLDVLTDAAADDPASALRVVLAASYHRLPHSAARVLRTLADVADDGEVTYTDLPRWLRDDDGDADAVTVLLREHLLTDTGRSVRIPGLLRRYLATATTEQEVA